MAYTTINNGSDYFNTVLYTGTGVQNSVTGVGFQPDWNWTKKRNAAQDHITEDAVRGATNALHTNLDIAEYTNSVGLTSFDSDGFTIGGASGDYNDNGSTYVSWNWLAGNGTSSNTNGSITSTVSVSTTSGFSIVKYTGTGSNATVGHGLSTAPKMIIIKNLSTSSNWQVYHSGLTSATYRLGLDQVNAETSDSTAFNSTAPTSSVFSVGTNFRTNGSGNDLIAYCFAEVKGFSKFGSYLSNYSTDGVFIYTGFRPAFVLCKVKDTTTNDWTLLDSARDTYNVAGKRLYPNTSGAESEVARADFLSNGFKLRATGSDMNGPAGYGYIYMAFAEQPLVTSNGLPSNAR